ncbi:AraC family transcriptional regulator [Massilia sp. W12]|uniref:AraC family transcriptional regulator n=1 Tax=Massilia sp. W12 TaxID=3126507 RepID=UPI0030D3F68F
MDERQAGPGRPTHPGAYYATRMARVLAYIDQHLTQPLELAELAALVAFSPFHFHRVFLDWQGETPQAYIRRARMTRAAALLQYAPQSPIREVALLSGFTSPESFVRAFRSFFDVTPSSWRKSGLHSAPAQRLPPLQDAACAARVRLCYLPRMQVAYQRKIGPYGEDEARVWARLAELLREAGVGLDGACAMGIGLDDPRLTPPSHCRFDACVEIPASLRLPAHIPVKWIDAGMYAHLPLQPAEIMRHADKEAYWRWLFECWLPASRFDINSHPCFELYPGGIAQACGGVGELCLPVKKGR